MGKLAKRLIGSAQKATQRAVREDYREVKSMNKVNMLYAAYGSNLNLTQMRYRCPYATVIGAGELRDFRLLFRGYDGNAVATVEPRKRSSVPVLLWEITPRDEEELDRYEGWPHLYRKEIVPIHYGDKPVEAMAYIMNDGKPLGAPSKYYLDVILEGYASAGFDSKKLLQSARCAS